MKKKALVAAVLAATTLTATPAFAAQNPFKDMPQGHWAYDAVNMLVKDGVIDGYGDGTFGGDKLMNRYEMAAIVAKAAEKYGTAELQDKGVINKLEREYAQELKDMDVRLTAVESDVKDLKAKQSSFKMYGDARVRYMWNKSMSGHDNSDTGRVSHFEKRVRLGIYGEPAKNLTVDGRLKYDDKSGQHKGFKAPSGKEAVTPEELALTADNISHANFGHYVLVKGATINTSALTITDAAGNTVPYFNNMAAQLPKDLTKKYNVYAIVGSHYNGTTKKVDYQLLPVNVTFEDGTALPVDPVADINALYGLSTGVKGMISAELSVIYQNGSYMWVKDANTYGLVYGYLTNKFVNGDKIKNLVAHWVTYDGYKEIIPVDESAVKSGEGAPVEAQEMALEDVSLDMMHQYITVPVAAE